MSQLIGYLALCALPAAAFLGLGRVVDWYAGHDHLPLRRPPAAAAPRRSLQELVVTLRRLEAEHEVLLRSNPPLKARRLQALTLAYDDTLRECCAALGLPAPDHSPLTATERLRTQTDLAVHGLTW